MTMSKKKKSSPRIVARPNPEARRMVAVTAGAAVGAGLALYAFDHPDVMTAFGKQLVNMMQHGKTLGGVNVTEGKIGNNVWVATKPGASAAIIWHPHPLDGAEHAFNMTTSSAPGLSLCGTRDLDKVYYLLASKPRCKECERIARSSGYVPANPEEKEPVVTPPPVSKQKTKPKTKRKAAKKSTPPSVPPVSPFWDPVRGVDDDADEVDDDDGVE
jgi:hypothetical protein